MIDFDKSKLIQFILEKTGVDIFSSEFENHYFRKEYERIFINSEYKLYKDRLFYFCNFLDQLNKIKIENAKDFKCYLNKLKNDNPNTYGEIYEIYIYGRLIDKKISFSKPKNNPDFKIYLEDFSDIYIECGSRQTNKDGFYIESIENTIINKQKKGMEQGYANLNTALHINISKLVYSSYDKKDFLSNEQIKEIVSKSLKNVTFGAILIEYTFYSNEDGKVYSSPEIGYHENCNEGIKKLYQTMFDLRTELISPVLKPFI